MNSTWKYVTAGIAAVGLTAASSSVMTAYVMRPTIPQTDVTGGRTEALQANAPGAVRPVPERPVTEAAGTRVAPLPAYRGAAFQRTMVPRTVQVVSTTSMGTEHAVPLPHSPPKSLLLSLCRARRPLPGGIPRCVGTRTVVGRREVDQ